MEHENTLGEWECRANDVVHLKLVMFEKDIEDREKTFHPTFTHQVFENQIIRGYKNPRIDMWYVAGSLKMYLGLSDEGRRNMAHVSRNSFVSNDATQHLPNTDVMGTLTPLIPQNNYTTNLDEFVKQINKPFRPVGKTIHAYTLMSDAAGEEESGQDEVEYEITKVIFFFTIELNCNEQTLTFWNAQGDFTMDDVKEYHKRIQIFVLWFIDCSSYIPDSDPAWEIYFVCAFPLRFLGMY